MKKKVQPSKKISIRFDLRLLNKVKAHADFIKLPYQTWIKQTLLKELRRVKK